MLILCNICCNVTKTHFAHTVNLYYISSGFCKQSLFPYKRWKLGWWWTWAVFVERYETCLEISLRTHLVFKRSFLHFIMRSLKEKRIESHKTMTFLNCLLRRAIKPSRNYRNSTFSGYSLNIFAYCLEHILSQVSLTF